MSEIASKANSRSSPGLAQPLIKKGGDPAHEMLFAALFGGVVAADTDPDSIVCGLASINGDADTDTNQDAYNNKTTTGNMYNTHQQHNHHQCAMAVLRTQQFVQHRRYDH